MVKFFSIFEKVCFRNALNGKAIPMSTHNVWRGNKKKISFFGLTQTLSGAVTRVMVGSVHPGNISLG